MINVKPRLYLETYVTRMVFFCFGYIRLILSVIRLESNNALQLFSVLLRDRLVWRGNAASGLTLPSVTLTPERGGFRLCTVRVCGHNRREMDRNGKMPDGDKRSSERKAGGTGGGGGKGCLPLKIKGKEGAVAFSREMLRGRRRGSGE
ncbi:Hypothetical protein SMAX5B_008502 [Scophthalmus maximus]|uniref:Uncharacterized protein n=1 Tax=Scophthalmus maximus TaxID=52904 RepID=A0A2U9CRB0_SCOMX|nr:Hypothetical protein SMAX5B_008502 [Scophthalmus maximus]